MGGGNALDIVVEPDPMARPPTPALPRKGGGRSELLTPQELTAFSTVLPLSGRRFEMRRGDEHHLWPDMSQLFSSLLVPPIASSTPRSRSMARVDHAMH